MEGVERERGLRSLSAEDLAQTCSRDWNTFIAVKNLWHYDFVALLSNMVNSCSYT